MFWNIAERFVIWEEKVVCKMFFYPPSWTKKRPNLATQPLQCDSFPELFVWNVQKICPKKKNRCVEVTSRDEGPDVHTVNSWFTFEGIILCVFVCVAISVSWTCSPHEGAACKENILVSHPDPFFLTASLCLKFAINLCLLKSFTV